MGETIQHNVTKLAELAGKRDPKHRAALYANVVNLFETRHDQLHPKERALMCDILRRLAHDVEMSIRVDLAERLAADENAPHDLILLLANDQIEVARPVLLFSQMLRDDDLIEVIYHKTVQHQLAVAARENLSEAVSSALVEAGNTHVAAALLQNQTASISPDALAILGERSQIETSLQTPLVNRKDLPQAVAERLYDRVSQALRATLLENCPAMAQKIDSALGATLGNLRASVTTEGDHTSANSRLVDKLAGAGQLTPAFLVKSLNQGQVELFELGFARLVNLSSVRFRRVIYNRGPEALAVACRAVGIDRGAFLSIHRLVCKARNKNPDLADSETNHAFQMFEKMDQRMAQIMIHRWSREEESQAAVA
ncbi:MAG: DUF2336 domain-containing protein [Alphaproteobacteria bacterium]|nr:MAG: DUF2336 domain-containing protein [Alphaproteobacteria bacterium]